MLDIGMQGKAFDGSVLNQSHMETCNQILSVSSSESIQYYTFAFCVK